MINVYEMNCGYSKTQMPSFAPISKTEFGIISVHDLLHISIFFHLNYCVMKIYFVALKF